MGRLFFALGSLSGALAVALGAFGAHVLKDHLPVGMLANFEKTPNNHHNASQNTPSHDARSEGKDPNQSHP